MEAIEQLHPKRGIGQWDPGEIANSIIEEGELPLFAKRHSANKLPYISVDLISFHYDTSGSKARTAKEILNSHLPEDELEEAADEEWSP